MIGIKRETAERLILDHEGEFPLSARSLANILDVSHQTVLRAGRMIDSVAPFDQLSCFLIADEVLGNLSDEG